MNLSPTSDRVFIRREKKAASTDSGILLPNRVGELKDIGTVVAVGPGRVSDTGVHLMPEVEEGDMVVFVDVAAAQVEVDGEKLSVVRERDVLAVIEP